MCLFLYIGRVVENGQNSRITLLIYFLKNEKAPVLVDPVFPRLNVGAVVVVIPPKAVFVVVLVGVFPARPKAGAGLAPNNPPPVVVVVVAGFAPNAEAPPNAKEGVTVTVAAVEEGLNVPNELPPNNGLLCD